MVTAAEPAVRRSGASGVLIAAFAAISVSVSNILTPLVYDGGSNPLTLLTLRYIGFAIVCWGVIHLRRLPVRPPGGRYLTCYSVGICYTIGASGLIASFAYLPVSLAILVFYTFPLLTLAFESVLDRRAPPVTPTVLGLLAFAGVALALGVAPGRVDSTGIAFALMGAAGISSAFVWSSRALPGINPLVLTGHMSLSALILSTLLVVTTDSFALVSNSVATWSAFVGAAGLFCVAFLAMFVAVGKAGASRTAMVMNLEAVFTVLLAVALLRESFSALQAVGATVVIGTILAMQTLAEPKTG